MGLSTGSYLGPYEILGNLGAGGMGEVYRSKDPKLGREIAIKVLREELAGSPEKLARFKREAILLASLNHPNIATIYSLEEAGSVKFLVLEFVPGKTLGERLEDGPIQIKEAITFGRQIADALESAHAKGVIHRDLKPANIKITPDGKVKVLDFGIAKSVDATTGDFDPRHPGGHDATREGVILGTPAYMSPEQAQAYPLDKRTDIWSFGCVLYEALAGRRAFGRGRDMDTLSAVLTREPDWTALPRNTPPRVTNLLERCLRKDPDRRLRDIADARIELEEALRDSIAPLAASDLTAPTQVIAPAVGMGAPSGFTRSGVSGPPAQAMDAAPSTPSGTVPRPPIAAPPDTYFGTYRPPQGPSSALTKIVILLAFVAAVAGGLYYYYGAKIFSLDYWTGKGDSAPAKDVDSVAVFNFVVNEGVAAPGDDWENRLRRELAEYLKQSSTVRVTEVNQRTSSKDAKDLRPHADTDAAILGGVGRGSDGKFRFRAEVIDLRSDKLRWSADHSSQADSGSDGALLVKQAAKALGDSILKAVASSKIKPTGSKPGGASSGIDD